MSLSPDPLFNIEGKKILLAGACGGFGREICKFLHNRGAQLFLVDKNTEELELLSNQLNGTTFLGLDFCNHDAVNVLSKELSSRFLTLDGAINAVGVFSREPSIEVDVSSFQRCFDINVSGALIFSQIAAKLMKPNGGSIIHLSSVSSKVSNTQYAAYSSSKAALSQLVRVLGREWADQNILVNAIGPAMAMNGMSEKLLSNPQLKMNALDAIPLGRFCEPEDIFGTMLLLLGRGGSFITGQTIFVDGGRTLN